MVGTAPYTPEAIEQISRSDCEVLLLDSVTTPFSAFEFVREAIRAIPSLKVMMIGMDEDEDTFLGAVRAGAVGYLLKDASAMDVVSAVRSATQDEAVCPPRLCLSLFKYLARQWEAVPNVRIKLRLGLTRRQQQLVPLIAQGLTNKEIASHLNLSEQTVKNHVHRMLRKAGVGDRLAVVEMVRVQGFLI